MAPREESQRDREDARGPKLKRTFYLDREKVVALSRIQADELQRTGHKPDLSELVNRAIRLLEKDR
jgi:hypothetical protein